MTLPSDRDARNALPVWDGCLAYFPDTWAAIAQVSAAGNRQHNLGAKLHWDTSVSTDHANKVLRHMLDDAAGNVTDTDGTLHLAKAAWRLLAMLQLRCWERDGKDAHGNPVGGLAAAEVARAQAATLQRGVGESVRKAMEPVAEVPLEQKYPAVCPHGRTICRPCNFGVGSFGPV